MAKKRNRKIPNGGGVTNAVQARYDAAGVGRRMIGWSAPASGPNRAVSGLATIRNRSRDANRNEWAATSSTRVMTTNLIGVGILARSRSADKGRKERLAAEWDKWCEVADADGVLDFYGLQTLIVQTWFPSGEAFARIRQRRLYDGLPAPLQVQVLEGDQCPIFDADNWPGMKAGHKIRQGIELDKIGRRAAYWMYREHPGDNIGNAVSMNDLVRVPADQVMHIFRPLRPGQLRGVPESAPILAKLRSVMNFDDAVLTRQELSNLFTMFVTRPMPTDTQANIDPLTGRTITHDASGAPMAVMEPGLSQELLPGEDVKFSAPPDAGANYADFMREQKLGIAAGLGTPYELMTGDLKDVSDRTLRVAINEFRRYCEQLQWQIIIPKFCKPVRAAWAQAAFLAGSISAADLAEATLVDWQPHGWAYIHPVQDVQGKALEVEAGFRSRSSVIAEKGNDPEAVDSERAEDQQREIDLGLSFEPVDPNAVPEPSPEEEAAAERTNAEARLLNAKAKRELDEGSAAIIRARADADRLQAEAKHAQARADLAVAEAKAAEASAESIKAKAASDAAFADLREAIERKESDERIRALVAQSEAATSEATARREALEAAERHADELRALAKAAEENRVEVSRLEVEAARVGLAELQSGGE